MMNPGQITRKILGKNLFAIVGRWYRAIFVDLDKMANAISTAIPKNAHILDIGGGDGEPLNNLLERRSDITVTMIDLAPSIGNALRSEFRNRVKIYPALSVKEYGLKYATPFHVIVISDVVHHVAPPIREAFFNEILGLTKLSPDTIIIIKDIQPKGLIARLSFLSDYYISGDKTVSLISQENLQALLTEIFGIVRYHNTDLLVSNAPNYAFYFKTL